MRAFALNELAAIFFGGRPSPSYMAEFRWYPFMMIDPKPGAWVWPAAMIVWGPGSTSARHSHHCVQLVMVLQGKLRIRSGPAAAWRNCGAALVRPDADHEVDARGRTFLIGFVDPESELGTALTERIKGNISCVPETEVEHWRLSLGSTLTQMRVERWVRQDLLNGRRHATIHPGVRRVLKYLRENLGRGKPRSLKALANVSGVSAERLMHVFTESLGVPIRPYILWLRLQRACYELMNGATATEAAQIAGFSDSAHQTRTFRRMLGTTPTELLNRKTMSQGLSI